MQAWVKFLICGIACGVLISLATGVVENQPEASIIGFRHYGYPMVWRLTKTLQPTEYILSSLAIDTAFWIFVSLFSLAFLDRIVFPKLGIRIKYKALLLPPALLVPLALCMDLIHEFGHAAWGTAAGGTLASMKVAFFEIFPQAAITPEFTLGYVEVNGLFTDFQSGIFLLGGSLTTNIASWILALTQPRLSLGHKTSVTVKTLGFLGLLDLPLYVLLPQIGLQHWLFLGGNIPEPLIGARKIGIPDIVFCLMVTFATLDLIFLHFKSVRQKAREMFARLRSKLLLVSRKVAQYGRHEAFDKFGKKSIGISNFSEHD